MKSAIDTNILLDIFLPDPKYVEDSLALLQRQYDRGALIIGEVVYAELTEVFPNRQVLDETLKNIHIEFQSSDQEAAHLAGKFFKRYREKGGERKRMIPDFLVGSHAQVFADCLITRDRGFYREYFKKLEVLEP